MKIKKNDLNTTMTTIFSMLNTQIKCASWQRTFDWNENNAKTFMNTIKEAANYPAEERQDHCPFFGNIIVYYDAQQNVRLIADGQHRLVSIGLVYKALHHICGERGFNIVIHDVLNYHHALDVAQEEYRKFVMDNSGNTNYSKVYNVAYKELDAYIASEDDATAVKDVLENYCLANITVCATESLAHEYFVNLNATGSPLTKKQIISSFLQAGSIEHKVNLVYDYDELENLIEAYYYVLLPGKVPAALSALEINIFMSTHVAKDRPSLQAFNNDFLKQANRFKNTYWYNILKNIDNGKSLKVGYALAGCGYDVSGKDPQVNEFLTNMVVANIIGLELGMTGSTVTSQFTQIKSNIGHRYDPNTLLACMNTNFAELYSITYEDFCKGLDLLSEKQQHAIIYLAYAMRNRNSIPRAVQVEEAYPKKAKAVWNKAGFPTDKAEKAALLRSLGNKLLLGDVENNEASNRGTVEKAIEYAEWIENNVGFSYEENKFDMDKFVKLKKNYLDARRDVYANLLYNTKIAKLVVKR